MSFKKYRKGERKDTYVMDPRLKISVGRINKWLFLYNKRLKEITSVEI